MASTDERGIGRDRHGAVAPRDDSQLHGAVQECTAYELLSRDDRRGFDGLILWISGYPVEILRALPSLNSKSANYAECSLLAPSGSSRMTIS